MDRKKKCVEVHAKDLDVSGDGEKNQRGSEVEGSAESSRNLARSSQSCRHVYTCMDVHVSELSRKIVAKVKAPTGQTEKEDRGG